MTLLCVVGYRRLLRGKCYLLIGDWVYSALSHRTDRYTVQSTSAKGAWDYERDQVAM